MVNLNKPLEENLTYWEYCGEIAQVASRNEFWIGQEIHVWLAPLDFDSNYYSILSEDEKVKAAKFRFLRDQHHYIKSHGVLRNILSAYVDNDPSALKFNISKYGKPFLMSQNKEHAVRFNMSHSENVVCYIVSKDNEVGIDIEYIKPDFDWKTIAKLYFNPCEMLYLENLPRVDHDKAFFELWTRKEALLKAVGIGLNDIEEINSSEYQLISFKYRDYQGALAMSSDAPFRFFYFTS